MECYLKATDRLISAPPSAASVHRSRHASAVKSCDGVFQTACLGKYNLNSNDEHVLPASPQVYSLSDTICTTNGSLSEYRQLQPSAIPYQQPSRTVECYLKAPEPFNSVPPSAASGHNSRLGPAVEGFDGVFQVA